MPHAIIVLNRCQPNLPGENNSIINSPPPRYQLTTYFILRCYLNLNIFIDIGGFHAISGDTNNNCEMNKCWWTNKAS